MTDKLFGFILFWGIWLWLPILIDGITTLLYLTGVWRARWRARRDKRQSAGEFFPDMVTIIIPVYNGQGSLGACLESIRNQSYPHECLQIVVVNNQSTDQSFRVFDEQQAKPFKGRMLWTDTAQKGKVVALNTGIHLADGTLIFNIDCDTVLHPDAILNMARAFQVDLDLAAATGSIQVLPSQRSDDPPLKTIWAECEAVEYLAAFGIGRQYQAATNSLFTLAGAFSAFRREVLLDTFLYDQSTVSEDTKLTLDIRQSFASPRKHIGCVADAIAYVSPTLSLSQLYAQRVRWQRGELEVAALYSDLGVSSLVQTKGLSISRTLMIDHTLAFPRLVWTFLMPMLYFLGYPLSLVINATIGLYIFYALIESSTVLTCYFLSDKQVRRRLRTHWYVFIFMPAYRFFLFWFRFGGFLNVLTDQAQWRVKDPWQEMREGVTHASASLRGRWRRLLRSPS